MSSLKPHNKIFTNTLLLLILGELLSFLGYYYSLVNSLTFFLIVLLAISVSLYRLEYGLCILLAELFIGSFGYLFYFESGETKVSIRLALWLIIMSVWLAQVILNWLKTKKLSVIFLKSPYFNYLIVLSIFIIWGLINGFLNGHAAGNIFFDFNNWLYFLLIFPLLTLKQDEGGQLFILRQIFFVAITWLSAKSLVLAYIFSHNFNGFAVDLYRWTRVNGLGEITQVQGGFSRVFMQSQIFVLIGFFILLLWLLKYIIGSGEWRLAATVKNRRFIMLPLFLSAIFISFSRSLWLGLAVGGILVWLIAIFRIKIKFKHFLIFNFVILFSIFLSLALTVATVKFPYPTAYGGFNPVNLLGERATQIANEAGASSRWQLLTPLWQKIKTAPVMGQGFGATVTYRTNDPRALASSPNGLYTTYTFEWGWFDIWLKLGLLGLLAYLGLIFKIIKDGLKINSYFSLSLVTGLLVLITVNIFSPYVNHPLGIGYIILTIAMMDQKKLI
ncbi:hypothetical protein A3H66_00940 [Candidatus Falkowbacteria bacterium RIFCSPLOWO2_02_FULL_45_21]|uniref:O-antigen ligase-related domain-containing protein n=1 Tax=Candidatus Falkowbacteria bacterium RIFCSPLOWO2_02_FULL_45_21 TaxID=1797989 RepID=A0A1F5SBV0_9BACT|nr:MAG: hypothetical protein A3H66_00940 [Candidatus Falkowbacteria bacterium RIFCSPLOWO2_02_FULL_45_21]